MTTPYSLGPFSCMVYMLQCHTIYTSFGTVWYVVFHSTNRNIIHGWVIRCHNALYNDVKMSAMASQITSLTIVYSTVLTGADQRKHQSSASLTFVWGIHHWLVNSPHKGPITRKMFPFDDVIMGTCTEFCCILFCCSYTVVLIAGMEFI